MPYGRQRLHLHLHQRDVGEGHHERSLLRTEHHRQADSDVGVLSLKEVGIVGNQAPTIGEGRAGTRSSWGEAGSGGDKAPGSVVFEGQLYSAFLKTGVFIFLRLCPCL